MAIRSAEQLTRLGRVLRKLPTFYLTEFRQSGVSVLIGVLKPVYNLIVTKTPFI